MIFQWVVAFGGDSSSLPHISFRSALVDLWQMIIFSFYVLFVIIDYHFVALGHICIGFLFPYFSLIVGFHFFFFGLCLLVLSFALYFCRMGSPPWFLYTWFLFFFTFGTIKKQSTKWCAYLPFYYFWKWYFHKEFVLVKLILTIAILGLVTL